MIFLTSIRLVFVKSEKSRTNVNFTGVELPLNLIEKPKFEQPVFGLNYLSGIVKPLVEHPNSLKSSCKWNIVFLNGECSSFLNYFFKVYDAAKKNKPLGALNEFNEQFFSNSNAYVDPNDPTFLYINEPNAENLYNPQGISQNHYISSNNQNNKEIPVYKRPYGAQQNSGNSNSSSNNNSSNNNSNYNMNNASNMMNYSQPSYMGNYDSTNNRGPYGQQTYIPNNMQNFNQNNVGPPNCDSQNNSLLPHYNQQDNRLLYNNPEGTMTHYNQHNNISNYDQLNYRGTYNHQGPNMNSANGNSNTNTDTNSYNNSNPNSYGNSNINSNSNSYGNNYSNASYNQPGIRTQGNQRIYPLHNQPNSQQFNPAYSEHFNNTFNQNCSLPTYSEQENYHHYQQSSGLYSLQNDHQSIRPNDQASSQANSQMNSQTKSQENNQPIN
ncbi:conserved Plasmodium protein, unknown function [Plasmodium malariae]|nr:conserved Plasmodium protein, unknown function [Plasmodium malariae]